MALGSCSCFGGVNRLKNAYDLNKANREVYGRETKETLPTRSVKEIVPVDLEIPGCPVSKAEVERIVVDVVTGADIKIPKYPVCVECKQKINTCVVDLGQICLGPVTRAGCDAVCPTGGVGCLGCRGPAEDANYESLMQILMEKGHSESAIVEKLRFYGAFNGTVG